MEEIYNEGYNILNRYYWYVNKYISVKNGLYIFGIS